MRLELFPRRSAIFDTTGPLPRGMTHPHETPCPFAHHDFPLGPLGTCCSLYAQLAVDNLAALGRLLVARSMTDDMEPAFACEFATRLRMTANDLELRHANEKDKPKGRRTGGVVDISTGRFTPWPEPSFEEAITSIREAADWYEKVGSLGFGVFAWY